MDFDLETFDNIGHYDDLNSSDINSADDFSNDYIEGNNFSPINDLDVYANPAPFELNPNSLDELVSDFDDWYTTVHGTPIEDSMVWHQQATDFTCGIVSSEMIMDMFGLDISESELVYEATSKGLLTENGMSIESIQEILQDHGINTHIGSGNTEDLIKELDLGHKIVIPLDSGEIWGEDSVWEDWMEERADHAVVLTGIDMDSIPPSVTLNDPGHSDGKSMTIELDKFIDAWNDSGNQYLSTDVAPDDEILG